MDLKQYEIYKNLNSSQRISIGCQLHDFAFQHLKVFLRQQMKGASEEKIQEELLKRFLGEPAGIFYKST